MNIESATSSMNPYERNGRVQKKPDMSTARLADIAEYAVMVGAAYGTAQRIASLDYSFVLRRISEEVRPC